MNVKKIVAIAAFCLAAVAVGFAADPNVGSWKLNEAKSKVAAGSPKNITVVYTAVGDSYKCVVDGLDAAGKPAHNEWTGKFDGKDYPVTGDPSADTRSLKLVSPGHYELTNKKDGKAVEIPTKVGDVVLEVGMKYELHTPGGYAASVSWTFDMNDSNAIAQAEYAAKKVAKNAKWSLVQVK